MELDSTEEIPYYLINFKESKDIWPNVELLKQEILDVDAIHLTLMQHEVRSIKSEIVSTEDKVKSAISNTLEPSVWSWDLKSKMLDQDCHIESNKSISIKQELLHEEFEIKTEDDTIQEPHFDDKYNCGSHLPHHTIIPSESEPFKCNICNYDFKHKANLQRHLRTHTGERPFKCNICEYSSTDSSTLQRHLRTHTGEKPFRCNICEHSFGQKSQFKTHLRTHTGEKPFKCNICKYSFRESGTLTKHLRTHTGEKPFNCNYCEYSCTLSSTLQRHLKTHTGEKPFKCNICDFSFRRHDSLQTHLKIHSGEKPFKCNICEYSCNDKSNFNRHMRIHIRPSNELYELKVLYHQFKILLLIK